MKGRHVGQVPIIQNYLSNVVGNSAVPSVTMPTTSRSHNFGMVTSRVCDVFQERRFHVATYLR